MPSDVRMSRRRMMITIIFFKTIKKKKKQDYDKINLRALNPFVNRGQASRSNGKRAVRTHVHAQSEKFGALFVLILIFFGSSILSSFYDDVPYL